MNMDNTVVALLIFAAVQLVVLGMYLFQHRLMWKEYSRNKKLNNGAWREKNGQ
jgi:hypothetical protein